MKKVMLTLVCIATMQLVFVSCRDTNKEAATEEPTGAIQEKVENISDEAVKEAQEIEQAAEKAVKEAEGTIDKSLEKAVKENSEEIKTEGEQTS